MYRELPIENEIIKRMLEDVTLHIRRIFKEKLREIILYGSYARSEQQKDSDLDVMILVDADEEYLKQHSSQVMESMIDISLSYGITISTIEKPYQKFFEYKEYIPFYHNVESEGILLYG